jgi:SEFIR domain-containing protein
VPPTRRPVIAQSDAAAAPRRVLISYAHDRTDPEHADSVRHLWEFLRSCGVDARLDLPAARRRRDWSLWMADEIRAADIVLVVASRAYRERAEGRGAPGEGHGVRWEARLIRDAFYGDQHAVDRFVPVVLPGQTVEGVPDFLAPNSCDVYHVTDFTVEGAESLLRLLTDQPGTVEPPLGPPPALPPRSAARPRTEQRPAPAVHNEFSGTASGIIIQAGSIGSVHTDGPGH